MHDELTREDLKKMQEELGKKYDFTAQNAEEILKKEAGEVFKTVLEHAGVFKRDEAGRVAFLRFAKSVH